MTDRRSSRLPLPDAVARAVRGGVTAVQVREPGADARTVYELVRSLEEPVKEAGALLIVNHFADVAVAPGADGVHLKRVSLAIAEARRLIGPERVLGVSTHAREEVDRAFAEGADYVVFGPVFPTPSKVGILEPRGADLYADVARSAPGPVLALGGVSSETLPRLLAGPLPGVALIRGILDSDDPEAAAREISASLAEAGS